MRKQNQKDERIKCKNCKSTKYKIVRTHGMKSRGFKVCKKCKAVIK